MSKRTKELEDSADYVDDVVEINKRRPILEGLETASLNELVDLFGIVKNRLIRAGKVASVRDGELVSMMHRYRDINTKETMSSWTDPEFRHYYANDADENARFSYQLRYTRIARGWTVEALAKIAGLSPSTVRRLENGDTLPSYKTHIKLAIAMDVVAAVGFISFRDYHFHITHAPDNCNGVEPYQYESGPSPKSRKHKGSSHGTT